MREIELFIIKRHCNSLQQAIQCRSARLCKNSDKFVNMASAVRCLVFYGVLKLIVRKIGKNRRIIRSDYKIIIPFFPFTFPPTIMFQGKTNKGKNRVRNNPVGATAPEKTVRTY